MRTCSHRPEEDAAAEGTDARLYRQARGRVHQRFHFYQHLIIYLAVISGLLVIDVLSSPQSFFVQWAAGGWGIGILVHFLYAFFLNDLLGPEAERRLAERELNRLENRLGRLK